MRHDRVYVFTALGALVILAFPLPAAAQEDMDELCGLLLQEARVQVESLELAANVRGEELRIAGLLLDMADALLSNDLITRAEHLAAKHRRDVTRLTFEFAETMVTREQAALDQYELACSEPPTPEESGERGTIEQARQRYFEADCALIELEEALARVDLEYQNGVLNRSQELRRSGIASLLEVMLAERNINVTNHRLGLALQRTARCQR
ncbi:MAG: hypothetical protein PVJ51_08025 [Acidobacteriota bacterium]|jgi:hypothetical protein